MKRILLFTHGRLSDGFLSALQVIASGVELPIETRSIPADSSEETITEQLNSFFDTIQPEDQVFAATDIAVGSTTKLIIPYMEKLANANFHIISGINLPVLMELIWTEFSDDGKAVEEQLREILKRAAETIVYINDYMKEQEE